jgi:putative PIN family toxin of toxin-antitoxin system
MSYSVVIDTNIFISALLSEGNAARHVLRMCFLNKLNPLMGNALFLEYEALIGRSKIFKKSALPLKQRQDFLDDFLSTCNWVDIFYLWRPNLRDEADNHLIELAVAGGADYIITGNIKDFKESDLLFPKIQVLDAHEFVTSIKKGS